MIYRELCGEKVSMLGMGCMRLPVIDGDDARIDEPAAREMIAHAHDSGINYFDTAYGYHGGHSQEVVASALSQYPRDSYKLVNKWPGYDTGNFGHVAEIFEDQLERCNVEYFDYYLIHNVYEGNIEQYLDDDRYGTVSYLIEQRKAGRIKHLGFSSHASFRTFTRFMDVFGDEMEFCQIQLNYLDWSFQDAESKVDYLNERGLPILVMEPLRGGILCDLSEPQVARLSALQPEWTLAQWAMRYVENVEGVAVVLTGASTLEQISENIETYSTEVQLSEGELEALYAVADEIRASIGQPCTACRYCVSHCPQNLDIPRLIELFNEHSSRPEGGFIAPMVIGSMPDDKKPSACISCRSCEGVCPQQIPISSTLAKLAEMVE